MLYIYDVMKIVGYIIIKHVSKHKEQTTTRYQNYRQRIKNNKDMRPQIYKVKMVYPLPLGRGQTEDQSVPITAPAVLFQGLVTGDMISAELFQGLVTGDMTPAEVPCHFFF